MRIARVSDETKLNARGGPALFQLVRFWSRRWLRDDHLNADDHSLHILVCEAVDAALRAGSASVGDVAVQLGIDRSGASRLISGAVDSGYLARRTGRADGRRSELKLTATGRGLLKAARRWQSATFLELVADWEPHEVAAFASYLQRLAGRVLTQSGLEADK